LYSGSAGDKYQVFLSSGDKILKQDRSASFAAYSFNIDTKTNPPQLVYTTRCPGGSGMDTTEVRRGWSGTALAEISSTPCAAN
ncbi:MAG: hypothetical protein KJ667_04955, partial [Alphaproteobacteria bacterium]|nr:hypothetical protein [Alphaproteobacteria bacterium]